MKILKLEITQPSQGITLSPSLAAVSHLYLNDRYINVSVTVKVLSLLLFHLYSNIFLSDPIFSVMMSKSTFIALTCDLQNHIFSVN